VINAGKAITAARQQARRDEMAELIHNANPRDRHRLLAYWWWGWDINGTGGLGKPGEDAP
jgi:hypothetical protein